MSVSIPWVYVYTLAEHFAEVTQMTMAEADRAALIIRNIAINAAESALVDAKSYTQGTENDLRRDITNSLNSVSEYLSDDIHILRQYVINELVPTFEAITENTASVTDEVAEDLINAYDAIAESQEAAGDNTRESIAAAQDWIVESTKTASQFVNDGVMAAVAMVGDTVIEITKGVDGYVQKAIDFLIPAEMQAFFTTASSILSGGAVRKLFDYGGDILKKRIGDLLTIDEAELETWVKKGSEFMQKIAVEQLQSPGGV